MDDDFNISPEDLQRLSPNEQRQLQVFLQSEQQKSQIAKSKTLLAPILLTSRLLNPMQRPHNFRRSNMEFS